VNKRSDYLEVAKRSVAKHYPTAIGAFVAGSITRGEGTPTSDIDIVVLFADHYETVHRYSVIEEDWPIEFFVHNPTSLRFYMKKDSLRGMCIMPTMVATGRMIPSETADMVRLKEEALAVMGVGPPALTADELELRRYMVTDLMDDLEGSEDQSVRNASLSLLHERLGDFHLRAGNQWSGTGKSLLRCLRKADEVMARRYQQAFILAFSGQGLGPVSSLVTDILAKHGGRFWEGYRSEAPPDWREFKDADMVE
jgi:hypothetical protein